jgi:crotonobetainyl-CoA:carnitine CoA-transferase CaiB-like acyl-CoA transferase
VKVRGSDGAWLRSGAPLLGEHTAEVLAETGYSPAQIDELLDAKVVAQPAHPGPQAG